MRKRFRKPYRVKKKKSIFRNRFFWLGVLTALTAGTVFYYLFFSEIFHVKNLMFIGEKKISREELKLLIENRLENKMLFLQTKSIFLVNLVELRKEILNSFPQIAEVKIGRSFPDGINIVISERIGIATFCRGQNCFLLDKDGIIFEETLPQTDLIKILNSQITDPFALGGRVIEKEKLAQISEIRSKLQENLKVLINEASIISETRLNTKTSEGWEIYFNPKGDLDWQIQELGIVLEKQIPPEKRGKLEYIDLRFSRVYYNLDLR